MPVLFSKLSLIAIWTIVSTTAFSQVEFIGMEYQGISNRTYVIFVSDSLVWGGKVSGPIAAGVSLRYSKESLDDPYFYANADKVAAYRNLNDPGTIKELDNANFIYKRSEIESMTYTDKKKWGMGDVRYSGRIFFNIKGHGKREFILLGKVDVEELKMKLDIK